MKEHIRYKSDTTPLWSSPQNIVFVSRFLAVILKLMLKITSIFPRDRGESLRTRRRRRSAFIYHTFIHTHTVTYFIITRQEIKQALKLKKSKSKCSFSRQVKRLDESKALESYQSERFLRVFNLVRPLSSNRAVAHDARSQQGIWSHRTLASACFFGNDRSSRSRVRTRLITKCVYYEWASDSFAYPCPCNYSVRSRVPTS